MPSEQSRIDECDQIFVQSLGQDDVIHAYAERRTFNIKGSKPAPRNVKRQLDSATFRTCQLVEGTRQPAAVPLFQHRGTRDIRGRDAHGPSMAHGAEMARTNLLCVGMKGVDRSALLFTRYEARPRRGPGARHERVDPRVALPLPQPDHAAP
jgi:hypothetical protein